MQCHTSAAVTVTAKVKIVPFREHSKYNLAVKNKRGLRGSTCGIDNYITFQEISTLYGLLFETSEGNHGQCRVSVGFSEADSF